MAKIGEGSLAAMGRLGLKELRNAINPSKESVADSEMGMYGTATQGEIAAARDDEPKLSGMAELMAAAKGMQTERGMDDPGVDRGMEM